MCNQKKFFLYIILNIQTCKALDHIYASLTVNAFLDLLVCFGNCLKGIEDDSMLFEVSEAAISQLHLNYKQTAQLIKDLLPFNCGNK